MKDITRPYAAEGNFGGVCILGVGPTFRILAAIVVTAVLGAGLLSQEQVLTPSMASLVQSERAFAETCAQKGIRQSFLEFLADSAILFRPHPVNGRKFLLQRPAPNTKPAALLAWAPVYAEVSAAGDLGYTTGPYELSDLSPQKEPTAYGAFFSIWKKQAGSVWKVVLDAGIHTSAPTSALNTPFTPHPGMNKKRAVKSDSSAVEGKKDLMNIERAFAFTSVSEGNIAAYDKFLCDCTRMHRNDFPPLVGKDSIRAYLSMHRVTTSSTPTAADVSSSGDLGFVYGTYQSKSTDQRQLPEKGYFVRVWRKNPKTNWVIAFDTQQPIPDQK